MEMYCLSKGRKIISLSIRRRALPIALIWIFAVCGGSLSDSSLSINLSQVSAATLDAAIDAVLTAPANLIIISSQVPAATLESALATIFNINYDVTLYVDGSCKIDGNGTNTICASAAGLSGPYSRIMAAAAIARANKLKGKSTHIVIKDGVYREAVSISQAVGAAPILVEAQNSGKVIISGSEMWTTGWAETEPGVSNIWRQPWYYHWGLQDRPRDWPRDMTDLALRTEIVFVGGTRLTQVLDCGDLDGTRRGEFCVDEGRNFIYIVPPTGITMNTTPVEVAIRQNSVLLQGSSHIAIKGLVIQHDRSIIQGAAIGIKASLVVPAVSKNFLIQDVTARSNGWIGLETSRVDNVVVRNGRFNDNGAVGFLASQNVNMIVRDTHTSRNNWRGASGSLFGFSTGGLKHLSIHNGYYLNHVAEDNAARAWWCDSDCRNIVVEGAVWRRNRSGGFVEASPGPVDVIKSTIYGNYAGEGFEISASNNITLKNNIFYGNGDAVSKTAQSGQTAQVEIRGGSDRISVNFETKDQSIIPPGVRNLTLLDNIFVPTPRVNPLIFDHNAQTTWADFKQTLTADRNIYWYEPNGQTTPLFDTPLGALTFADWQKETQRDLHSDFVDPRFNNPIEDDFTRPHLR